jgi:two-component sensor histidine kinase
VLRARLQASEQGAARLRARCEHQADMMRELAHRLKNSLTLVQAMISQTLRDPPSLAAGRATLLARVVALGQAHRVLVEERWLGTTVQRTVETALAAHDGAEATGRFAVAGPAVRLGPRQTVALSMALHELATNAAKYGALSCEAGRVRIAWHTARGEAGRTLHLCWSEHGGPPVAPPARRGFGSRLIERTVTDTLGGEVVLRFAPDGVVCTMRAVIRDVRQA